MFSRHLEESMSTNLEKKVVLDNVFECVDEYNKYALKILKHQFYKEIDRES